MSEDLKKTAQREINKLGTDAQKSYREGVKSYQSKIKSLQDLGKMLNGLTKTEKKDEAVQSKDK